MVRGPLLRPDLVAAPAEPRPSAALDGGPVALWRRGMARILDALVVLTVLFMFVVIRLFWFVPPLVDRFHRDPWGRALVVQVTFVVMSAILEVVFLRWSMGQTPGRDRLHVRVVRVVDGDADPLGPEADVGAGRALARWAVPGLAILAPQVWPGLVVVALCGLPALVGDRRSLPDRLAGTRVVRFDRTAHEVRVRGHDGKLRRRPQPTLFRRLGDLGRDVDD